MQWGVLTCSQVFDRLARRIFHERRKSAISWVFRSFFGFRSIFGEIHKWLTWILNDGCYDASIFDLTLKDVFSENRRIVDSLDSNTSTGLFSKTKVGVVATSIAR